MNGSAAGKRQRSAAAPSRASRPGRSAPPSRRSGLPLRTFAIGLVGLAGAAALAAVVFFGIGRADAGTWVEQGRGGSWTDVSADRLAAMLPAKDFTLVDVKTPYIGEIQGTDLYIPYDELAARASELPADRTARILVYCRSGNESRIAAQTLLDLGYTNVWNLDKGMESWVASGRSLIQKPHGNP